MEVTMVLGTVLTLFVGVLAYLGRDMFQRLSTVELASLNEAKVRIILADKIDPLKEDIREIKDSVGVLMEYNLQKSTRRVPKIKRKAVSSAKAQR